MVEQRLIDANRLEAIDIKAPEDYQEWPPLELFAEGAKAVAQIIDQQPNIDPESLPIVQELREEIAELKKLCDKLEEAERAVAHLTPDWIKKLKPGDKVLSSTPNIFTPTLRIRTVKSVNKNFTVETTNGALYKPRLGIDNVVHLYRTGRWVGPFYFVPWYDELIPTTEERLKEAYYQAVGKHDEEATEIEELLRRN